MSNVFNIYISTSFWFNSVDELNAILDSIKEDGAEYVYHTSFDHNNLIERTVGSVVISEFEQGKFHKVVVINDNSEESLDFIGKLDNYFDNFKIFRVQTTKVSNMRFNEPYDVYCGRGSDYGNPHRMFGDGSREESIRRFKHDFDNNLLHRFKKSDEKFKALRGKVLGCYCHPKQCHVHVLALYLNARPGSEENSSE